MHKRQVPLSHMSRGQRMVMLALNKRTKAIASGVSKVEKSVYTQKVKQQTDDQRRYPSADQLVTDLSTNLTNAEVEKINELSTEHDHNRPVTQLQVENELVVHNEDTVSYVLPAPTSDVQTQQMLQIDDQTTCSRPVPPTTEQGHQSLRKRPRKWKKK